MMQSVGERYSETDKKRESIPHSYAFHPNLWSLSKKGPPFHLSALKPLICDPSVSPSGLSPTASNLTHKQRYIHRCICSL